MRELSGKTAVITGAASGIGRALAERVAAAGMHVVLADVEAPRLEEVEAAVRAAGVDALSVVADVSDPDAVDRLRDAALARFDRVNLVCNNAGVAGAMSGDPSIELPEWRWVMGVNFWGVVHGHRSFLPHLLEHGDGHIVNTASMAGHLPGHSSYSASKWAVVAVTEGLYHQARARAQAGQATVGVSCLCPGWVDTDIGASSRNRPEWAAPQQLAEPTARVALVQAYVLDQLRSGMAPDRVADLVHDAIVADRFWIFTDPHVVASLEARYEAILSAANPPVVGVPAAEAAGGAGAPGGA
jgi:NAD(P)-dependent dehydrogenase (short-subunit alcohol dehydrogenase family)